MAAKPWTAGSLFDIHLYRLRPSSDPGIAHFAAARPTAAAGGGSSRPGRGQRIVRPAQHARPALPRPPSATRHLLAHHSARRVNPSSEPLSPGRPVPSRARRARRPARRGRPARVGRAVHERRDRSAAPNPRRWAAASAAIAASAGGRRRAAAAIASAAAAVAGARRLRGRRDGRGARRGGGSGRSHLRAATTRKSSRRIGWGRRPGSNRGPRSNAERGGHLAPTRRVRVRAQCPQAAPRWRRASTRT